VGRVDRLGSALDSKRPRPCGLCGDYRALSRAHVPPRVAGNVSSVQRAPDVIDRTGGGRTRRPGSWVSGGLQVRGLCERCNHLAGRMYDQPYADFASDVRNLSTAAARRLAVMPGEPPPVFFAPGLVARCVIFGMFAINPRLRIVFPHLAEDLLREDPPGSGPVRWPDQLVLRVGRVPANWSRWAVLSSGIWSMRVISERVTHFSFGDVVFDPLVWSLVPRGDGSERKQLGPAITERLADASGWIHFGPDRTAVDLRNLTRTFPALLHPAFANRDEWVEMRGSDEDETSSVFLFGKRF
jgi:hypothetical protein